MREEYDVFELYDYQQWHLPAKPESSGRGSKDSAHGNALQETCCVARSHRAP
jgi:hypothetical protein